MNRSSKPCVIALISAALPFAVACSGPDSDPPEARVQERNDALSAEQCPAGSNVIRGTEGPDVLTGTTSPRRRTRSFASPGSTARRAAT